MVIRPLIQGFGDEFAAFSHLPVFFWEVFARAAFIARIHHVFPFQVLTDGNMKALTAVMINNGPCPNTDVPARIRSVPSGERTFDSVSVFCFSGLSLPLCKSDTGVYDYPHALPFSSARKSSRSRIGCESAQSTASGVATKYRLFGRARNIIISYRRTQ